MRRLANWSLLVAVLLPTADGARNPALHAASQSGIPVPAAQASQVEPIRCWWQSSAGAIAIGELFSVTLTCAVLETESVQVVPDESRLGVASVQLAPFELLGGSHPRDSRSGARRFFQYQYDLRIINPDVIGRDVNLPALAIGYRVRSQVGGTGVVEGRDLSYLLPAIPLKVLSLVPAEAPDIRDGGSASLGVVDDLRFRSSLFNVLGFGFGALALVVAALTLIPMVRRAVPAESGSEGRVPDRAVRARVAAELGDVQSTVTREGWTDALVGRALSALRLTAALAIGKPVSQHPLPDPAAVPEGRLLVAHGRLRPARVTVSSGMTAADVDRAEALRPEATSETVRRQLSGLRDGLLALTAALYPQEPIRDPATLNEAVRHAATMLRERG